MSAVRIKARASEAAEKLKRFRRGSGHCDGALALLEATSSTLILAAPSAPSGSAAACGTLRDSPCLLSYLDVRARLVAALVHLPADRRERRVDHATGLMVLSLAAIEAQVEATGATTGARARPRRRPRRHVRRGPGRPGVVRRNAAGLDGDHPELVLRNAHHPPGVTPMRTLDVGPRIAPRVPHGFDTRPYERFGVAPLGPTIGAEVDGVDLSTPDRRRPRGRRSGRRCWSGRCSSSATSSLDPRVPARLRRPVGRARSSQPVLVPKGDTADVVPPGQGRHGHRQRERSGTPTSPFTAAPALGAVLRAVEVPSAGGDTMWADMCGGVRQPPPTSVKARIDGLTAVHDWRPELRAR